MFPKKRAGLLGKILLIVVLAYMIFLLIGVRQKIAAAKAEVESLTEQVAELKAASTSK